MRSTARHTTGVRRLLLACVLAAATGLSMVSGPASHATGVLPDDSATTLRLVTLTGPGASGLPGATDGWGKHLQRIRLLSAQESVLQAIDAPKPAYRWTSALNGFAVDLTDAQAREAQALPGVSLVEDNTVHPLAARRTADRATPGPETRGGAGVVIGIVDTGLDPEGPVFAANPGLGRASQDFRGDCADEPDWKASTCNAKVVGADWFIAGFGADRVRSTSSLSPLDDSGHGTHVASVAAGNAEVSVRVGDEQFGTFSGVAPQARVAVYKACWSAPDPADDGCATADVVSAIDRATADGVDVLNLSVSGSSTYDTVERAMLGAAEADVVVVAAAGNDGGREYAAHPAPWVTTVGGVNGPQWQGRLRLGKNIRLTGAMSASHGSGPARVVDARDAAAEGSSVAQARHCLPGSLDVARTAGKIVICERGRIGRIDKSATVQQADGVAMILLNTGAGSRDADLHSVPTVHLSGKDGRTVRRWLATRPAGRAELVPAGVDSPARRVSSWSNAGDPAAGVLKPDLVGPATGVLGAVPASVRSTRWDIRSGTSTATAAASGTAALIRSTHDWSAPAVRSALATTTEPVRSTALEAGAGRLAPDLVRRPGLVHDVSSSDYRAWLDGTLKRQLNTPSILLHQGQGYARRTITNVSKRRMYFSSTASGFIRHDVTITPAAVRLAPGESATYTVRVSGPSGARPRDDGQVTWLGANGTRTRVPVLLTR